jgi:hypothetical protein
MVDEAEDPVRDMGIWGEEIVEWVVWLLVLASDALRSGRPICLLLAPSCVYEGRLAFTMFPSASLQSLFLVANIPNPSPPASSSFSLWRAICRSLGYVRPRYVKRCSETYRVGHGGGNGPCSVDTYYSHPCGSTRDGEDVRIWKTTSHSLGSHIRTSS